MESTKVRRFGVHRVVQTVMAAVLLLLAAGGIMAAQCFNGGRGLFGHSARLVMSSSMEIDGDGNADHAVRDIPTRSLIVIQLIPTEQEAREKFYSQIREGDVLTFVYRTIDGKITVTHRVKQIERNKSGFTITLCGDNGASAATQLIDTADAESENRIIGKVVFCSYALGVLICILRDPLFLIGICIIVLSVMLRNALRHQRAERAKGPPQWRET